MIDPATGSARLDTAPEVLHETRFQLSLPGPLDVAASVEFFRRSGDDMIDRWDGAALVRTLPIEAGSVAYACTVDGSVDSPTLRVTVENSAYRDEVERAVGRTFVSAPPEYGQLLCADPVIARLDSLFPGLRPVRQLDLLAALVRSISAQQVNLRWAVTTRRRLAEQYGDRHVVAGRPVHSLNPGLLAGATVEEIRSLQFTTRKAEYIVGIARAVVEGRLDLTQLAELPDEEVIARLTSLRGIGLWTAEWLLARTLGRPRVVAGDLGVRKAVGLAYLGEPLPGEAQVRAATEHWGPSAGVAQALLLHALGEGILGRSLDAG